MKLKLDEDGHAVIEDGKPVYEVDGGKSVAYDVPALMDKVQKLNHENAERRVRADELEAEIKAFKGIDPRAAREALKFREALGEDADPKGVADRIASLEAEREGLVSQLEQAGQRLKDQEQSVWQLTVSHEIASSPWVRENVLEAFTPERLERLYGDNFKVEKGRPVAYDANGKIMSRERPGEPADVNEALSILIGSDKSMLRAGNASGSGSPPSKGNGSVLNRATAKLSEFHDDPRAKVAFIKEHGHDAYQQLVANSKE